MPLVAGTHLGPYEVLSPLGAGGMGEVYRARDTRLGREVAIKVLPAAFSQDADRLRRFEQEARAAGMLNHPNILVIYDIGAHDGAPYMVSELLEGETLRERIGPGALPMRKAVDYALQVARGLAAAHEKGIIHRDLKPENLFLTKDGRVKILDFGLAKLTPSNLGQVVDTEAPTGFPKTDPGVMMGTVGYMSPEQVQGVEADYRADIFAFGVILYEMLTGKRAFQGQSVIEVLNAILREEPPDLIETNQSVPAALERVVRHCLEKNPAERFQSTNDLSFAIESLIAPSNANLTSLSQAPEARPIIAGRASRARLGWIVAVLLLLVALVLAARSYLQPEPAEMRVHKLSVMPPEKAILMAGQAPIISPDGSQLAFVAVDAAGRILLYVRPLDSLTAQPLAGTDGASLPFWSPDSRSIGFFASGKLKKIEAAGGQPATLADAPTARGGSWNRDGVIIFAPTPPGPLFRVSASGGEPTALTTVDLARGESPRWFPQFLPDGRHYLFHSSGSRKPGTRAIGVGSLDSPAAKPLLTTGFTAVYAPPGYLLFRREATLMAQRFDADQLELTGDPFPIAEQIGFDGITYQTLVSASDHGVLAYQSLGAGKTQMVWFDRSGRRLGVAGSPGNYSDLALSPDDKRVAFQQADPETGNVDIWLMELASGTPSRFSFDPAVEFAPVWSPDGSHIAFASLREGAPNLFQKVASGAGQDELLFRSPLAKLPGDWSRDNRLLVCSTVDPKTKFDLWVFSISGERQWEVYLQTPANESRPSLAPNGQWIAYESDESGRREVYVQSFPTLGSKWQISAGGGSQPCFKRDGKELFYLGADRKLMAVDVKTDGSSFSFGPPKALFETRISGKDDRPGKQYAVTSDGQHFLVNTMAGEGAYSPITVLINWTTAVPKK